MLMEQPHDRPVAEVVLSDEFVDRLAGFVACDQLIDHGWRQSLGKLE